MCGFRFQFHLTILFRDYNQQPNAVRKKGVAIETLASEKGTHSEKNMFYTLQEIMYTITIYSNLPIQFLFTFKLFHEKM